MNCLPPWLTLAVLLSLPAPAAADGPSFADFDARARAGEKLNVVFFGSSLTWGANASDPMLTSYRARVAERLEKAYPQAHFKFWDAALGGTNSQLAVFRLERDVLSREPDLVFLDFTASDDLATATPETLASYEALVRRIVRDGKAPVVQAIFPFQNHIGTDKLEAFGRRQAHLAIGTAYGIATGDAVALTLRRVQDGKATLDELWPIDRAHPGDAGYAVFAEAVWTAFEEAVRSGLACKVPEKMLHADTYMNATRFRLAGLADLPPGWRRGQPHRTAAYFDMLMSRWLDDEVIAGNRREVKDADGKKKVVEQEVGRLRVEFKGTSVILLGESTEKSCKYRVHLDGQFVERNGNKTKEKVKEFDGAWLAYMLRGNTHLVHVIAEGLDPGQTHTLEIEPVFPGEIEQELRLESLCIAGGEARVVGVETKQK